jgi:hypothetical protein
MSDADKIKAALALLNDDTWIDFMRDCGTDAICDVFRDLLSR